jgi:hypothetical protein
MLVEQAHSCVQQLIPNAALSLRSHDPNHPCHLVIGSVQSITLI